MQISEKIKQGLQIDGLEVCGQESCMRVPRFRTLNINITGRCNERCVYCTYSQHGHHKSGTDIDQVLFYRVTREARELGVTDVGFYTTGEPFLNPNIYEYIAWCKKIGFPYVYLSTNGLLCTPENFNRAADAGLDSLKFSVSGGCRDTFYKHHDVDAFDLVRQNIMQAHQYRQRAHLSIKLFMFVIVTRYNMGEKELIREAFGDYVDEIIFSNCVNDNLAPMTGVAEYLVPETGGPRLFPLQIPCPQLFNKIVVNEEGWLCACCAGTDYVKLVDLRDTTLKDAINCQLLKGLRKRHLLHDVDGTLCENCVTGRFRRENMRPMNSAFERACATDTPLDIRSDIIRRFQPDGTDHG